MISPIKLIKMLNEKHTLTRNHPELFPFLKEAFGSNISEGTEIEIRVKKPGQDEAATAIEVQESEIQLFKKVSDIVNDIT